jgi:hypothetical protein
MNSGVPQSWQKPRATTGEERNVDGVPRVQVNRSGGTLTSGAPSDPKAFWHMRQ